MAINGISGLPFDPNHTLQPQQSPSPIMATPVNSLPPPPATVHFPLSLGCTSDRDPGVKAAAVLDFFSDMKEDEDRSGTAHFTGPDRSPSDLKTGLHLTTGSDNSIVVDEVSPDSELDKKSKNEMVLIRAEMERMSFENQQLRDKLIQTTNNFYGLQMHVATLMQQQQTDRRQDMTKETHNGHLVPRQFMDLGLAANNEDVSLSPLTENKESEGGEEPHNKVVKRSHSPRSVDQAAEATLRKARVAVRARSEAPMITDGCQWRKYGQKSAKGNPWPRAYYRCTMAGVCPVRKQVQRCAEDTTVLITTYEGNHNHPLPPAAMAMASTTSSAARMLLSGSMPSSDGLMNSNILARSLFPCSSNMATISASAPFPTITLDLTQSPNPLQLPQPQNQFSNPFLNTQPNGAGSSAAAALLPQIFGQALYNQSKFSGLQMPSQEILEQGGNQMQQGQWNEKVNALATDPNFTAALATAISSFMGSSNNGNNSNSAVTTSNSNSS